MNNFLKSRSTSAYSCAIVLDTSPARNLAHETELPAWAEIFSQMKADGYMFSLAECACGELINQRSRGSICDLSFNRMVDRLAAFLDPKLPVMPGERDVLRMIGALRRRGGYKREVETLSQRMWNMLQGQQINHVPPSALTLEEERVSWKGTFETITKIYANGGYQSDLDELADPLLDEILSATGPYRAIVPPLSKRFDLRTRYFWRQFVRTKKDREPYNLDAPKKANDGIDFRIYTYLALPALIVATERGFFSAIKTFHRSRDRGSIGPTPSRIYGKVGTARCQLGPETVR